MNFIIDDPFYNTFAPDNNRPTPEGRRQIAQGVNMLVNITDSEGSDGQFFGHTAHRWSWITHSNPLAAPPAAGINVMPSYLHSFTYDQGEVDQWRFQFDYLRPWPGHERARGNEELGVLSLEERNRYVNFDVDYLNPRIRQDILNYYVYLNDPDAEPLDSIPEIGLTNNQWELITMSLGSWGVTYEFTIDITNVGTQTRQLQYFMEFADFAAVTYRIDRNGIYYRSGAWAPYNLLHNDELEDCPNRRIEVPVFIGDTEFIMGDNNRVDPYNIYGAPLQLVPGERYTITVSVLMGVGMGGFFHRLTLLNPADAE